MSLLMINRFESGFFTTIADNAIAEMRYTAQKDVYEFTLPCVSATLHEANRNVERLCRALNIAMAAYEHTTLSHQPLTRNGVEQTAERIYDVLKPNK